MYEETFKDMIPELLEELGTEESILDSEYPHISKKIVALWGSIECLMALEKMICDVYDPRRGERQGFSLQAHKEIRTLLYLHMNRWPFLNTEYTTGLRQRELFQ
jgi:hypothetical protein